MRITMTPARRPTNTSGSGRRPARAAALAGLTRQVSANNRYAARSHAGEGEATMAFLRQHIRHVIYIVKENRTYDQVLGDLEVGDGDPKLTVFGRAMTPNQHALARQFVDLDAFFDSARAATPAGTGPPRRAPTISPSARRR
jgi:phospholipase C